MHLDTKDATVLAFVLMICALAPPAFGQVVEKSFRTSDVGEHGKVVEIDGTRVVIPDVRVVSHKRKSFRLYSDLISNKLVLLNFFYTSCSYICGIQGDNLSLIQTKLGKRLGQDVFMISISMDPHTDTPSRLRGWARMLGAKAGWTLVGSTDPEMLKMIKDFTGDAPGAKEVHSSRLFIGNDRTGIWTSADGLLDAEEIIRIVERLSE
jgi:protein SCO1/2